MVIDEPLQLCANEFSVSFQMIKSLSRIKILSLFILLLEACVNLAAHRDASLLLISKLSILLPQLAHHSTEFIIYGDRLALIQA